MCGIAGILRTWQPGDTPPPNFDAIPEAWLDILDDSIKHRGPDGKGRFRHRVTRPDGTIVDVALVHRRLSIIDHADGAQPMVIGCATENACTPRTTPSPGLQSGVHPPSTASATTNPPTEVGGSENHPLISREGFPYIPLPTATDHHTCPKCGPGILAVVFNGCIYNHRELRRELEAAGHVFASDHSDTEVLLHGWREWGGDMFMRLEGMYALALFDGADGRVIIARDRAGEKPLYGSIRADRTGYIFGSAPTGFMRLRAWLPIAHESAESGIINSVNHTEHHLPMWLASGYDFELPIPDCEEIPPDSAWRALPLEQCAGGRPWLAPVMPRSSEPLFNEDKLEQLLDASTKLRLEADVPVGCFLSGGVDSSLIATFAKRHRPDIRTFTVRMPDGVFDESPHAEAVAKHLGLDHTTLDCESDPAHDLVALIEQLGLPFGDSSLLPTFWLSRAVRQVATVALSGDGGDELYCGYERYCVESRFGHWSKILRMLPHGALPQRHPKSPLTKASRLIEWSKYGQSNALFDANDWAAISNEPLQSRSRTGLRAGFDQPRQDFKLYLPCDILRKTDTASMAVALEVRSPLLSSRSIASGLSAPLSQLMPNGQRKGLLRAVARKYLPAEIVDRPKMGFAIPIGEWFRSDYGNMRQLLYDHLESADPFPGLAEAGIEINMSFVQQMLREHDAAGERSINPWHGRDHSQRLYMLVVLSIWCRWLTSL
ncbi:MAG: asparagine synthase (glutamine-hydrolyzing) [Planctomycetota bacterium]|nr:asparagine synthase (glutamine-hydrolyzing) [Planctomycetota bacterium]